MGCSPGPNCPFYTAQESCIEITWSSGGGSGTGGGSGPIGGTGSGSGSGGGWVPPNNPNPCGGVALRTEVQYGCGVGWVPAGGGGGNSLSQPIDSMLAKYFTAFKAKSDSMLAKSLLLNQEHSMIIVRKGDSIYLKNEATSHDSLSTQVNFSLAPGESSLGYIHYHPSKSLNILDRSAPSGLDVKFLREHLVNNFAQLTECGNAAYAMVIEDTSKARIFLDSLIRLDLNQQLSDSAQKIAGWFGNWQKATQLALVKLLGPASLHGIGIYKSTDVMRKSWIKLN